jgi:hypothetical protein
MEEISFFLSFLFFLFFFRRWLLTMAWGKRALWNASVAIYDPYKDKMVRIMEFPGITRTISENIGGVQWDQYTGLISILVDSAAPWATAGADVSGDNLMMKYNPKTQKFLWNLNITAATKGLYGGFQDVEHDKRGNTYIVGTWPGTIMKVDASGTVVEPWFLPPTVVTTKKGYGGLVGVGEVLLTNDGDGQIYRFDMRDTKGKPVLVPMTPNVTYTNTDAIYAPPLYDGTILLVASHTAGIQVLRSKDATWGIAEYLGTIPKPVGALYDGSGCVAAVQMGSNSVYMILEWFGDPFVPGQTAGNRSSWPMPDITADLNRLLR